MGAKMGCRDGAAGGGCGSGKCYHWGMVGRMGKRMRVQSMGESMGRGYR